MQTLIEWQELGPRVDSVLQAASVVWWCGVILIMLSLLVVLGCALRGYRGVGLSLILPSQSEFMGFGLPAQRGNFISHTEGLPVSSRPKTSPGPRTVQGSPGFTVAVEPGTNLTSRGALKAAV